MQIRTDFSPHHTKALSSIYMCIIDGGVPKRVGGECHAVVEVPLRGNVLQRQPLYVAVGVTVGEDVHPLLPHLLSCHTFVIFCHIVKQNYIN